MALRTFILALSLLAGSASSGLAVSQARADKKSGEKALRRSESLLRDLSKHVSAASNHLTADNPAGVRRAASRLKQVADLLQGELESGAGSHALIRERLEAVMEYSKLADDSGRDLLLIGETTERAKIIRKTEPPFTEEARRANTRGVVILLAMFAADGEIKHVVAVKSLPNGLTEKAVAAARGIKFEPARKDGRVVSQVVLIEYNFDIY